MTEHEVALAIPPPFFFDGCPVVRLIGHQVAWSGWRCGCRQRVRTAQSQGRIRATHCLQGRRGCDNKGSSPPRSEVSSSRALIGPKCNIYIAISGTGSWFPHKKLLPRAMFSIMQRRLCAKHGARMQDLARAGCCECYGGRLRSVFTGTTRRVTSARQ